MTARKHTYRILNVGESYETAPNPPSWLRTAIYRYAGFNDKKFSVCKVTPRVRGSAYVIRRTA